VEHQGLRVLLHGGGDGDQGQAAGDADQDLVGGAHGELRRAGSDLLVGDDHGAAGNDLDVEALGFIKALKRGLVEATHLGLGVPIGLEDDGEDAVGGGFGLAGEEERQRQKEDRRVANPHRWLSNGMGAE